MWQGSKGTFLVRATVVVSIALALSACVYTYAAKDEKVPFGTASFLVVSDITTELDKAATLDAMQAIVEEQQTNLLKTVDYPRERTIFAFIGDPSTAGIYGQSNGYPSFQHAVSTLISDYSEIGTADLRGGSAALFGDI
jgi:hypothetical protein